MATPIRLKLAKSGNVGGGGFTVSYTSMSAKVDNLGFTKEVVALYTPYGEVWKGQALHFAGNFGTYDLFEGTINEQVDRFALSYSVAGQTYYDNNEGANYALVGYDAAIGGDVMLHRATSRRGVQAGGGFVFTTSWVDGQILVKNLTFAKEVGVRMSADGGATWWDSPASFAGMTTEDGVFVGPSVEVWRFKTPELNLNLDAPQFRFAVFYRLGPAGPTIWDNNFDHDYRLDKAEGAAIA